MARDQVFISYSHKDKDWLERLQTVLAPLLNKGKLKVWADTDIQPGQRWKEEIKQALAKAKLAVLLVSPDFLASRFTHEHELPPLLEEARKDGLTILWIPARPSLYWETEIDDYQAVYDPNTPLSLLNPAHQEAALIEIARKIKDAFPNEATIAIPEPSPSQEPIPSDRPPLPPIKNLRGWSAARVQELQRQTAQALGLPVEFRDELEAGDQGPVMVVIPAGRFLMGSPEGELKRRYDEHHHEVEVALFALGKYAVTGGQFKRFVEVKGYRTQAEKSGPSFHLVGTNITYVTDPVTWWNPGFSQTDNHPVVVVTWNEAMAYAAWFSEQTGRLYRLPTEAEWEYACRAGTTTPFYFGETISTDQANYYGNNVYGNGRKGICRRKTVEVGQFPPNAWRLHDMHGNVWEWTCSVYDKKYGGAEQRCAELGTSGPWVVRGGSWGNAPGGVRGAARYRDFPRAGSNSGGVRLARTFP